MNFYIKVLLFLTLLLYYGCNDDDSIDVGPAEDAGAIFVEVRTLGGSRVAGATVTTIPETSIGTTNSSGVVLIGDVEPGIYQVCAMKNDVGAATGVASVMSNEADEIVLILDPSSIRGPMVNIISPQQNLLVDLESNLELRGFASDLVDNPTDLIANWSSNIDGNLAANISPSSNGLIQATASDLTAGSHVIRLEVTDTDGNVGTDSVFIEVIDLPDPLNIVSLTQVANGIEIRWEQSNNPQQFTRYEVQRQGSSGGFQTIASITDVNQLTFVDNNVELFQTYTYRIIQVVSGSYGEAGPPQSIEFVTDFIAVNGSIERMLADPERPFIYAVDRVNNNLHFIDLENQEVSNTIFVGSAPVDLDLHPDGDLLYIANFGSSEITVVDLNEQEIAFTFFVETDLGTWDGNPYRIALLDSDRLAFTSEDQWNNIKIVNAENGVSLATSNQSIYQPGLLVAPNGTLYASESGSTGSSILRYDNQFQVVDESNSSTNFSGNRDALITSDGQYLFYNSRKILATNLQSVLGQFSEGIYAINSTGTIAVGNERYYSGETFAILGYLPFETRIMVYAADDEVVYLYDNESSRVVAWVLE